MTTTGDKWRAYSTINSLKTAIRKNKDSVMTTTLRQWTTQKEKGGRLNSRFETVASGCAVAGAINFNNSIITIMAIKHEETTRRRKYRKHRIINTMYNASSKAAPASSTIAGPTWQAPSLTCPRANDIRQHSQHSVHTARIKISSQLAAWKWIENVCGPMMHITYEVYRMRVDKCYKTDRKSVV